MFKDEEYIRKVLWQKVGGLKARDKFSDNFVANLAAALQKSLPPNKFPYELFLTSLLELLISEDKTTRYTDEVEFLVNKMIEKFKARQETIADEIDRRYKEFDAIEYRAPTSKERELKRTDLTIKVRIPPKSLNEQLHLDLKKRALSFCHGAYILLKALGLPTEQQNTVMEKIFSVAETFEQQFRNINLQHPEQLKLALKKLDQLVTEMAVIITPNPTIEELKKTHEELLDAEILANCERRKPCVIITPAVITSIGSSLFQIETIEPNRFTSAQKKEMSKKDTKWQQRLSTVERYWLAENKEKLNSGEFATPSTVLMTMPGAANVSHYELVTSDNSRYTSMGRRTFAPMSVADEETRLRLAKQNAEQLKLYADKAHQPFWVSGIKIDAVTLEQSLLSPLQSWYIKYTEGYTGDNNNTKMLAAIDHALKDRKDVICTNWPVNAARMFSFGFLDNKNQKAKDKFEQHFIKIFNALKIIPGKNLTEKIEYAISSGYKGLGQFVKSDEQAKRLLMAFKAYQSYREMMQNPKLREEYAHRNPEMFIACLERLMIEGTGGIISSGCKSAKDREGTTKMHTTAMILYFNRYGKLPTINDNDKDRENFAKIFADVHHAGHQQHMANLNSYGAQGCQSGVPSILQKVITAVSSIDRFNVFKIQPMLPVDLKAAVDCDNEREKCQDLLARSNKVHFDADHAMKLIDTPRVYPQKQKPIGSVTSYGSFYSTKTSVRASQRNVSGGSTHRPKT